MVAQRALYGSPQDDLLPRAVLTVDRCTIAVWLLMLCMIASLYVPSAMLQ